MAMGRRGWMWISAAAVAAVSLAASAGRADEIRLKDGKKLYGVIVAYEDNMFKVKTDFGYVLVEKDKIASIIPDTPAEAAESKGGSKPSATRATGKSEIPGTSETKSATQTVPDNREKAAAVVTHANAKPELPIATKMAADTNPPALKAATPAPKAALAAAPAAPPPPGEEPASSREEIQGNLYINHEFGFRMYKAPSWQIIDGAGQTLPNAIVAMGTSNESTLLVVGLEKTKAPLESAADTVEKRLHDAYDNYRRISQRKTVVSGQPAMEYRYRGLADGHDWSGTLTVVARPGEVFTVLGMTFADTDLIQIQENVISRSIASLEFGVK
jgi:hypothetical protein